MRLFDSHCHLHWEEDAHPVDQTLARARDAGVDRVVCVGIDCPTSARAREIAALHPGVLASAGIHPNDLPADAAHAQRELARLGRLLDEGGWAAVGETGLDLYWDRVPLEVQRQGFSFQLGEAARRRLPLIIHCRQAGAETLQLLQDHGADVAGVMHCYSDSAERVSAFLDLGLHISFAGNLSYKQSGDLREAARRVPLDRLLVETDAPFLAPQPRRGKRNEPAFVRFTLDTLAEVRGMDPAEVAELTWANAAALFGGGLD
ncbi:MAG: TatD family hydrolase [Planctomycetes bacterium]|nr:TatD family hydrolase [Planctomycetota bacterium]